MVETEVIALRQIQENNRSGGQTSHLISCTRPGTLVFDRHLWELLQSSCHPDDEWDVDEHYRKMIVIPFCNRDSFVRAYRIARLMRSVQPLHRNAH
ncbi:hypothetical protein RSM67_002421 [Enterobacter roggenkampii]|uniref:hypothetical protein n=1 Tax=Enterobacter roggenkampii TaxID=1812935 RepID=UPI000A412C46|nr:hypothetical protein [Enterobacter roggenkampii]EHL8009808.1 hypothetical protein [Escherichia coli]ELI9004694.1 hypothetical protein [Enterobacter roggenkampii]